MTSQKVSLLVSLGISFQLDWADSQNGDVSGHWWFYQKRCILPYFKQPHTATGCFLTCTAVSIPCVKNSKSACGHQGSGIRILRAALGLLSWLLDKQTVNCEVGGKEKQEIRDN